MKTHKASALTVAVLAALFGSASALAAPASSITVAHPTVLARGDAVVGSLPVNHPIHIAVSLKLRNKDALDAFVGNALKTRAKGATAPSMSSEQILANHAPSQQQAQAVADYLTGMGFKNVKITEGRFLVTADGTAAIAGRAFQTSFRQVRKHDGRIAFANVDEAHIPASLADKVQAVIGLQTVHQLHIMSTHPKSLSMTTRTARPRTAGSVGTALTHYYFPDEWSEVYAATGGPAPINVIAGILAEGDMTATITDLNHFTTDAGYPTVVYNILPVGAAYTDTSGQVEWNLDSQDIIGAAGGQIRQLNFYTMPDMTNTSLVANIGQAVNGNKAKIINGSLGECELGAEGDGSDIAADAFFEVAVAQGQTFAFSTGDSGADECKDGGTPEPSWPANSQYVVAVAGTSLDAGTPATHPKVWASEVEWTGSGGSESTYIPKPSWQTLWGGTHRGVADIAFDADSNTPAAIWIGPPAVGTAGYYGVGGTSLSAPIFSGLWARVLQHNAKIGFAGPVIYGLNSADFHDITSGSNGISAGPGYDLASGRGSLIFSTVLADIDGNSLGNHAPAVNFSYAATGGNVAFTDASTDNDFLEGPHSYSWDFGDGSSKSTATSPSHTYAAPGTYKVKESVTDTVGAVGSKSKNLNLVAVEFLKNAGFESGSGHWSMNAAALVNNATLAHSGNFVAGLGGGAGQLHAYQTVTIPSGYTSATLGFWLNTVTSDPGGVANDTLSVQVWVGGVLSSTVGTYSNLDATGAYSQKTADLSAYVGQTVTLKFISTNDATLPTTFYVDDTSLQGF